MIARPLAQSLVYLFASGCGKVTPEKPAGCWWLQRHKYGRHCTVGTELLNFELLLHVEPSSNSASPRIILWIRVIKAITNATAAPKHIAKSPDSARGEEVPWSGPSARAPQPRPEAVTAKTKHRTSKINRILRHLVLIFALEPLPAPAPSHMLIVIDKDTNAKASVKNVLARIAGSARHNPSTSPRVIFVRT